MINILDKGTIDKIAAGEVVERPASIVKELLENSIDAGSSSITVEIKNGGIDLIRITDNGCGIDAKEVKKAFLRHATSKIISDKDLISIKSLGFRGEALSSIAAVSRCEMITKTRDELTGVRYYMEGGVEVEYEEIGAPDGTSIIIRDIFYNTPARRKFLKTASTEGAHISELVEKMAMSNTGIAFKFISNNQIKLQTNGNGNLKDIIYQLYGKEISKALCVIDLDTIMPGFAAFDFGDSIRFGANKGLEDEVDLSKVGLDIELFEAFTRGFLEACGKSLNKKEIELLHMGAIVMTYECGIRFLGDYIAGDKYFKIARENHNLDRARTQIKLISDMEEHIEEMKKIVEKYI